MTESAAIARVIVRAIAAGNSIKEVSDGWTKVRRVTHMMDALDEALWQALQGDETQLRSYVSAATPHNAADRGFIDDEIGEAVSFPLTAR